MFDPLPLFPAILQSPQLVRLLTHFNTLKGAGGVSGPRRLDPWRFSLFWWLLRPLPPGSAAQSVDSTRVLAWWQNLFCDRKVGLDYRSAKIKQEKKRVSVICSINEHQTKHNMDLNLILKSLFTYLKDSSNVLLFVLADCTNGPTTFVLGVFELLRDTTTALKPGHVSLPMSLGIKPRQSDALDWHY